MKRIITIITLIAGLAFVGSASASIDVSHWRDCNPQRWPVTLLTHNLSCTDAMRVARGGFGSRWKTRVGGFRCTRERNAGNVVWLYTCTRRSGSQGVFIANGDWPGEVVHNCSYTSGPNTPPAGNVLTNDQDCATVRRVVRAADVYPIPRSVSYPVIRGRRWQVTWYQAYNPRYDNPYGAFTARSGAAWIVWDEGA